MNNSNPIVLNIPKINQNKEKKLIFSFLKIYLLEKLINVIKYIVIAIINNDKKHISWIKTFKFVNIVV